MKYAILGSAFNPPHNGHRDVIQQVINDFDKVILVPSFKHPFGKKMAPFDYRLQLTAALAESCNSQNVVVSDVERTIDTKKSSNSPIFTFDVLHELEATLPKGSMLRFVVGPDNAKIWDTFYKGKEVKNRWGLHTCEERVCVRSTLIRSKLENEDTLLAEELVPSQVQALLTDWNKKWGGIYG